MIRFSCIIQATWTHNLSMLNPVLGVGWHPQPSQLIQPQTKKQVMQQAIYPVRILIVTIGCFLDFSSEFLEYSAGLQDPDSTAKNNKGVKGLVGLRENYHNHILEAKERLKIENPGWTKKQCLDAARKELLGWIAALCDLAFPPLRNLMMSWDATLSFTTPSPKHRPSWVWSSQKNNSSPYHLSNIRGGVSILCG